MPQLLDPRRSAHASIRGYLYQALLGVERWLALGAEGEAADAILCEGDEDLDRLVRDGIVSSEQVKDYSGSLGIGDRVVRETLARFVVTWVELRRQGDERRFVFTTTASLRAPRSGVDVLGLWYDASRREDWIAGVREWVEQAGDEARSAAALGWLDEQGAWDDLRAAIDWGFDAPGIEQTRGNVARRLADGGVSPALRETLIDRLLARVLEASVEPRVQDRVLTALDRDELLRTTEAELTTWAATPRAAQLRRTLDEESALRPLLESATEPLPENAPPSKYLTARYEVIPFQDRGREQEIAQLTEWSSSAERAGVLLIHGAGGTGKTRLLIEWCRRLRHQGWHAGFLDRDVTEAKLDALLEGVVPRCLVLDYGETRPGLVATLLHRANRLRTDGGPKVRIVLLARTAGEWWRQLRRDDESVDNLALASPGPIELTPLVPHPEERPEYVTEVAAAYAAARGTRAPAARPATDYSHPRYERVLYLHFEALLRVLDGTPPEADDRDGPLFRVLDHERQAWWRTFREATGAATVPNHIRRALDRGMAAITLAGGADSEADTHGLLRIAAPTLSPDPAAHLVDLLRRLYPPADGRFVAPLEPDLLGEELVRQALTEDVILLDRLLEGASASREQNALVLVGRLLEDERTPIELAERVMPRLDVDRNLPVPLRDAAATAIRRVLVAHLTGSGKRGEAHAAEHSRLLNNLGVRLSQLGRREEALEASRRAVDIRRKLAEERPGVFLPKLAGSLINLGSRLGQLGQREEAFESTRQAVDIYQRLAEEQSGAFLPDLAVGLNNLGVRLSQLGRREEALEPTQQAVDIRRKLAEEQPAAFLPDLASSLNNLALRLSELGRREEALEPTQQGVDIRRKLAEERPAAFLPDLASSLNNLGLRLSQLGRRKEALEPTQQAVDIRRKLAEERPEAFLPALASSLNSLGIRLSQLGRRVEALEPTRQAVDIRRKLAEERPEPFLPDLASSLNKLGVRLSQLGRREEALEPTQQAVDIRRKLAEERPEPFLPDLASSLNNLGLLLSQLGRREEALEPTRQAVDIRRKLAEERPGVFLPNLAMSLNSLGGRLSQLGRRDEALEPTQQAVDIRRKLAGERPEAFLPNLAGSLNNLGLLLSELGRREEALEPTRQAVDIRRKLAEERPEPFLPDLARSLNNLGVLLSQLGRCEQALEASEEAVRTLGPFFLRMPGAFRSWMASMVGNYRQRCEEAEASPDEELLAPLESTLAEIDD